MLNMYGAGFPDDDFGWTLDGTSKRKISKSEAEETPVQIRQCAQCFGDHRVAPVCPYCGYLYPIRPREVEQIADEMKEVVRGGEEVDNIWWVDLSKSEFIRTIFLKIKAIGLIAESHLDHWFRNSEFYDMFGDDADRDMGYEQLNLEINYIIWSRSDKKTRTSNTAVRVYTDDWDHRIISTVDKNTTDVRGLWPEFGLDLRPLLNLEQKRNEEMKQAIAVHAAKKGYKPGYTDNVMKAKQEKADLQRQLTNLVAGGKLAGVVATHSKAEINKMKPAEIKIHINELEKAIKGMPQYG
jgi:hypothetical protein